MTREPTDDEIALAITYVHDESLTSNGTVAPAALAQGLAWSRYCTDDLASPHAVKALRSRLTSEQWRQIAADADTLLVAGGACAHFGGGS